MADIEPFRRAIALRRQIKNKTTVTYPNEVEKKTAGVNELHAHARTQTQRLWTHTHALCAGDDTHGIWSGDISYIQIRFHGAVYENAFPLAITTLLPQNNTPNRLEGSVLS